MTSKDESSSEPVPLITDKRGSRDASGMPSAEELLAQTDPAVAGSDGSEFERQASEEADRLATWEAMSDEEKQAVLAQQAAQMEANPYQGAGIQTEHEEGKRAVISYFAVIIMEDGTALATDNMDVSGYEKKFDIDGSKMHRACTEVIKDIETTDTAVQVMLYMKQQAEHAMAQQRASALQGQLAQRGSAPPRGRRR